MAYYKTQIKSVGAGYAFDTSGKRLAFIGYFPCKAGDFVWTDGKIVFGNISNKPQPIIFDDDKSGVPVLTYDKNLRGYFDKLGRFKKYDVAKDISDEQLKYNRWFLNSNDKIFYGNFNRDQPYYDIDVTDDNNVFIATTYSAFNYDSPLDDLFYFKIYGLNTNTSDYSLDKNLDDFKGDADNVELMFLKLQKGDGNGEPVKWFAVFKTTKSVSNPFPVPDTKHYEFVQHSECVQEISWTQPGIWNCTVEVIEENVNHNPISNFDTHEEIYTIDSDGNKKIIYTSVSSDIPKSTYQIKSEAVEKVAVDYERYGMGPGGLALTRFEGTVTIEWTLETLMQSLDHYSGYRYDAVDDWISFDVGKDSSETFKSFTYPVDDFYISADNIYSTLKLYDSDDNLVLDFATSDDEVLSELTGFHNFSAVALNKSEYLLTLHQWNTRNYNFKYAYLWKIKNGKATLINDRCYNYRLRKMDNITKARR